MRMRGALFMFSSVILVCCGPGLTAKKFDPTRKIYLRKDLGSFSSCKMEHSDCNDPSQYCVESPRHLGGARQCMTQNQIGEFFACTSGDLIILPDEPWQLDCLQGPFDAIDR